MKRRVYWTAEEKAAIYRKMVTMFIAKPHLTKQKALQLAQTVLPKDRWRKITATVAFKSAEFIESARQDAKNAAPLRQATVTITAKKEDPVDNTLDAMADAMAEKIVQRIQSKLANALTGDTVFNFSGFKSGT